MTIDYGNDLSCALVTESLSFPDGTTRIVQTFDAAPNFGEISGRPLLIEALVRRLVTPRGALVGDPNYGTDVRQWLEDDIDTRNVGRIGAAIAAELQKDERVRSSSAVTTFAGNLMTVVLSLVDQVGPFKLTLAVNDVTVKVLGVA